MVAWVLLVLALSAGALCAAEPSKRVALVIGNSEYTHVPPLPNPGNDAAAVAEKLTKLGFEVTPAIDLSLGRTREVILDFGRRSFGAEVSLIFYAGHGLQVFGDNYFLPIDARLTRPEELLTSALMASELHAVFAFAQPRIGILILDACRDNPFVGTVTDRAGLASGSVAAQDEHRGTAALGANLLTVFAAAPGQVAKDGADGNSPFTTALLQWVDRPGLEIGDLFRRVRETVLTLTNGEQVPFVEDSLVGQVYLRPPLEGEEAQVQELALLLEATIDAIAHPGERRAARAFFARLLPEASSETVPMQVGLELPALEADPDLLEESLVWLSIRGSDDARTLERFLAEFPNGVFADLARSRAAELRVAQAAPDPAVPKAPRRPAPPASHDEAALGEAEDALGLDRDARIAVQRLLTEAGHYSGSLDGAVGPMTRSGISAFQNATELVPSGYLNFGTLDRLVDQAAPAVLRGPLEAAARHAVHAVAAIARGGPQARPVVIRVATHQRHPEAHMHYRELADDFEARYPGTKVEYDVRLDIEYRSDLLLMLGSEAPPDIFLTYGGGHLRSLVEAGFARDLTEEMAAGWALTYKPGALTNLIIGERIFAVPMRMTLVSLWGNRRLLDEAGVDPGDLDTWEGLLEGVERLRAAGINPLALGAADGWPVGLYWGGFAQGLGGREALDRALAGRDGGFAAAPFVEAGRRLAELAVRDAFQRTYPERSESEANGTFTDGHAAMTLNGDWLITRAMRTWPGGADRAAADLVRIPFPPEAAAEEPATYGGVDAWVVRAGAPERAVDFLRELAGLESQRRIAELGLGIPAIAGADTAIADPLLREVASELTRSRYHQLYFDQLLGPLAGEALNAAAVMVVRGEIGPDEAAAEIEASWAEVREAWGVGAVPEPEREPELVPAE